MAEQFFHMNHLLRKNQLDLIREKQLAKLEKEISGAKNLHGEDSVESLRRVLFDSYEKIAPMMNANIGLHNQRTKSSMVLQGGQIGQFAGGKIDNVDAKRDVYYDLTQSITNAFTKNNRSGKSMMLESVKANASFAYAFNEHVRSSSTFEGVKRSMNHLKENSHGIVAFDLETFGGVNEFGKQELDKITEFSFLYYDDVNAKKESEIKTGYVGITSKKEEMKYQRMLSKYMENPTSLTGIEEITLKSFAKLGSGGLLVEEDKNDRGRFTVTGGSDERNIKVSAGNIRKGIQRAKEIGTIQGKHLTEDGLMKWEKDLADAIIDMQTSKRSIMGHNILEADMPWLNQYMSSSRDEFKDYITGNGAKTDLSGIGRHRIVDTFSMMQHAMSNERFRQNYLDPRTRSQLAEYGLTPNTLEALSLRGMSDAEIKERMSGGSNKSHTSIYDARETFEILNKKVGNQNLVDYAIRSGEYMNKNAVHGKVEGNSKQLFYAAKAIGGDQNGIMGFKVDPFDGQYYTMDGYTINPNKSKNSKGNVSYSRGFSEFLTKKGMTYTVEDMVELGAKSSLQDKNLSRYISEMREINPSLAVDDLIAVKLKSITSYDSKKAVEGSGGSAPKLDTTSYILSSRKNMQNLFNNNMIMYAEKTAKGEMKLKEGASRILSGSHIAESEDGLMIRKNKTKDLIKDVIKSGSRAYIDDTAGRQIREMDYNKFRTFSDFSMGIERDALKMKGSIEENRKQALKNAISQGQDIAKKISKNKALTQDEQNLGLVFDVLGYKDFNDNIALHPGRLNNAVAMTDYFREMNPILEGILPEVKDLSKNKIESNYLFRQAMDVAMHEIEKFNNKQLDVRNATLRGADKNYFEVDLPQLGMRGSSLSTLSMGGETSPLRINLSNGEGSLLKKIASPDFSGKGKYVGNEGEEKRRLYLLIESLHEENRKNNNLKSADFDIKKNLFGNNPKDYIQNNRSYVIAKDLIEQMKEMRKIDPNAGYLTRAQSQTVTGIPDIKTAISNNIDIKNVVKQSTDAIKNHKAGSVIDIRGVMRNETELNKLSKNIVTNILMDKFSADQFKGMGYTDDQVNWLSRTREIRERDYQSLVKQLIKGVSATNMSMHFDRGTGLFAIQDEKRMINLSDVPRERIVDGVIYTQVGRNRIATEMRIGVDNPTNLSELTGSNFKLQSSLGSAMDNAWNLPASVIHQNKRGVDPMNTIESYIGKIASQLREGSDVDRLDEADSKHVMALDEKAFINNLSKIPGIDSLKLGLDADAIKQGESGLKEGTSADKEWKYFLKAIEKDNFSYDKMNDAMRGVYVKHRRDIMEYAFNQVGASDELKDIVGNLSNRLKPGLASDGKIRVYPGQYEMEAFNNPNRIFEGSAKYLGFREDIALKRIEELDGDNYLKGKVYLGANLRTALGQSRSRRDVDSLGSTVHTEAIVKRAYTDSESFKKKLYNVALNQSDEVKWASERARELGNLYEGGAVASSRLGDALLQSYDRQRVSASRRLFDEMRFSIDQLEEMKKFSEVVPEFRIGKDGKIEFEYSRGKYFKQGETFLSENAYGGSVKNIGAKNDGVLRQAFFSKTLSAIATEDEVRENVMKVAKEKGLEVASHNDFINIAEDIYDNRFYIERLNTPTYQKLHEDRAEKGMTTFAYTGLGGSVKGDIGDKKIIKALDNAGLSGLKGSVLSYEFFKELQEGNIDNGIIRQLSTKDLTNASFDQAVRAAGYNNVKDFGDAISKERHELSDFISKQYDGAVYLSNTEDAKHKNVSRPINMMVNEMFVKFAEDEKSNGLGGAKAEAAAAEKLVKEIGGFFEGIDGKGLEVINNRVVTPQMDFMSGSGIDYKGLKDSYATHTGKDINHVMNKYGIDDKHQTGIGYAAISLPEDYTSISGAMDLSKRKQTDAFYEMQKGFKVTDREMNFLGLGRISDGFIQDSYNNLSESDFNAAYGFMVKKDDSGKILLDNDKVMLRDGYDRRAFLDPFKELVDKEQFAQNGDELLIRHKDNEQEIVKYSDNLNPGDRVNYQKLDYNNLSAHDQRLVHVAKGAAEVHGGDVSWKAAKTLYSVGSVKQAIDFNRNVISEDTLKNNSLFGFGDPDNQFKLGEIDFTTGNDAKFFKQGIAKSIYDKDTIIDLSEIDDSILRDANISGNKIAIGAISSSYIGQNVMQEEVHKRLKDVQLYNTFMEGKGGPIVHQEHDYNRFRTDMVRGLTEINDLMSEHVTKKAGALKDVSEIRMSKSAIGKSSLMTLEEGAHNELEVLKNTNVNGKSILEHHKNGVLMDFNIASREFVEKMGLFDQDYLDDLKIDKAQMEDRLRQGVQVMAHRNPTIYEKSVGPSILVLSDNTHGNRLVSYAAGSLARKEDADGDQTKIKLLEALNERGEKVDSIDMMVGSSRVDAKATEGFDMYNAALYRNATEINPYFAKAVKDDMKSIEDLDEYAADKIIKARNMDPNFVRPELSRLADDDLRQALYSDFQDVETRARKMYESSGKDMTEFADDKNYKPYLEKALKEMDDASFQYYGGDKGFAVDYYLRDMSFISSQIGSNKQAAAGEMNLPLYKTRKVRELAYDSLSSRGAASHQDMRMLDHILEASEEAFLSPKHNEAKIIDNTMVVEKFNKAFRETTGMTRKGETAGTQGLVDWFAENLPGRYKADKPLETIGVSVGELSKDQQKLYYQRGAELIQDIFSEHKNIDRLNMYLGTLGQTKKGIRSDLMSDAFVYYDRNDTMMDNSMNALRNAYDDSVVKKVNLLNHEDLLSPSKARLADWTPPVADNLKDTTTKIFDSAKNFMSDHNIKGKHLAFGALGMAGATMVLGFTGGNPSDRSATTAAAEENSLYRTPIMSDEPVAMMQANPSQGYVININGSTPKGQRHAQEAIQAAVSNGYNSTNVNIAMNINNSGGNITDSTIERMIEGML